MIDWRAKGFPALDAPLDPAEVAAQGWNLFDGRFLLPTLAVHLSAIDHNIALIADFCARHGVSLAPHGKTSMAPALFRRQLAAGAWGITLASAWQARVGAMSGVPRIVLANQVVDPAGIEWLASTLDEGPEVTCWVDSIEGVELLEAGIGERARKLPVLVELGLAGGRTGLRDDRDAIALGHRVAASRSLRPAGVSFFEGIVEGATPEDRAAAVRTLVERARAVGTAIAGAIAASGGTEIILTAGGSAYLDLVVEGLAPPLPVALPTRMVLRAGATVSHDHGGYDLVSPFGSVRAGSGPRLRPALEVWAPVLSTPEPGLAIALAGKRDLSFDAGMPPVLRVRRRDGRFEPVEDPEVLSVTRLNDQHAYVREGGAMRLAVGDLVALGVRHACTGFDRWGWVPVIDDDANVVEAWELVF
jgi:D-serine deaminase-like pyridoxal phosphate-dependent protein